MPTISQLVRKGRKKKERKMSDQFLGEPRRGAALAEVNGAIDALEHLGQVMAAAAKAQEAVAYLDDLQADAAPRQQAA